MVIYLFSSALDLYVTNWYIFCREDFKSKNKKKSVWQVICFTEDDWFQLTKKFKSSEREVERQLYQTLNENFLPELPRLFKEKERLARKRLLEKLPKRSSSRLRKLVSAKVITRLVLKMWLLQYIETINL